MPRKKINKDINNNSLKTKIESLLVLAEKDKKFLLETQKKLADDVQKVAFQLVKNEGALAILKKILEDK
jgi:hypothetical protein